MLQLQRASAGSGKTYLLAKKFIEFLISVKEGNSPRRLRTDRELRDSLQHILAITFTNKATNEMKLRIVAKLDDLGNWTPDTPVDKVDYLQGFADQFHAPPQEIARICRLALRILLTDYGDFKVSTIDSFFQTVLRTFAYEADLDDTYQIELDSDYVARIGLDTTLDALETSERHSQEEAWIEKMIGDRAETGRGWNIFQKNEKNSVYSNILNASRNLSKEDFKVIREQLDAYFAENANFFDTFRRLNDLYEVPLREAHEKMREAARMLLSAFDDLDLDIKTDGGQYLGTRAEAMSGEWDLYHAAGKGRGTTFKVKPFTRSGTQTRVFDPRSPHAPLDTPDEDRVEQLAADMYAAFEQWRELSFSPAIKKWSNYRKTLPYLGLLHGVRENSRLFLTDSNTIELGETNSILNRIIGDDDAPFVYERIGSRLNHFLIDEFQDTSRLQWNNLHPLVAESEGRGNDNLIIGDAKQSIYRFRNADPSLITTRVPEQFPGSCRECGNTPKENTNWRSSRHIVQFNNLFFKSLAKKLSEDPERPYAVGMEALYANAVQPSSHKEDKGYVCVQLCSTEKTEDSVPVHFVEIPILISSLLERGYRQKDVAVLVDTNKDGQGIISSIMDFNLKAEDGKKINFISAESLKIGESQSVQTIVSVLESINKGTGAALRDPEEKKGVGDWSKLKADFSYYAMSHPEMTLSDQLRHFLAGEYNPDSILEMLGSMSTTVLPALTENICHEFIPADIRDAEAPFLAAFQDKVIEFCDTYTSDIASFLQWWTKKGANSSINSPEGTDAVQIMTVHKSKGLEFKCVIVANSKQTLEPDSGKTEWLWVEPELSEADEADRIPWIPLETCSDLADTPHREVYFDYLKKFLVDTVNMAYVAYTRAKDELYIFAPGLSKTGKVEKDKGKVAEYLWDCGVNAQQIIEETKAAYPSSSDYFPHAEDFRTFVDEESGSYVWTVGTPPDREEVIADIMREEAKLLSEKRHDGDGASAVVDVYRCDPPVKQICVSDPASPEESLPEDSDSADSSCSAPGQEDSDENRREGELLHSVMQLVRVPGDLPRALLRMKTRGFIDRNKASELQKTLGEAIESVKEYRWFDPGLRVLNERDIAANGRLKRPDRVVIRQDGSAAVVDYKFGDKRDDSKYSRQVKEYARIISGLGMAKKCEAYIWYVSLGTVVDVSE